MSRPAPSPTIRHALKKARTSLESEPAPLEADGLPAGEDDTVDVPEGGKVAKGKKSI